MTGPLAGIKVLDVGAFSVGPYACSSLAQMGAEAIRVEPPHLDGLMFLGTTIGGYGWAYIIAHFNKKNIILDIRQGEGKELFHKLIKWADIIINNRRLGAMDKLGYTYEALNEINPRVIYIESSSYGNNKGPWAHHAAADQFVQASSGFASINGKEGGEAEIFRGAGSVDMNTTAVIMTSALSALLTREITGKGMKIETSMLQSTLSLMTNRMSEFFATGVNPKRLGSSNIHIVPSQSFRTWDNRYINISVHKEKYWPKLCQALELQHLQNDPKFKSNALRVKNRKKLIPLIEEKIADKSAFWWMLHLQRCDVPCGLNYNYEQLSRDPHVQANKWLFDIDSMFGIYEGFAAPWEFSKTAAEEMTPTVKPDRNRDEILAMLNK
ncbi:MAG: CoA transferase [Dehalococcoidia bacterium]